MPNFFNKYPYTDFHELNLDWIINTVKEFCDKITNFISLNVIKYADPIGWNIITPYAENTVVFDMLNNIAYLSKQAVPAGIDINNTDYWQQILDFSSLYQKLPYITPQMFGAIGDNVHDDTSAISTAYDYAKANNFILYFPLTADGYKTTSTITCDGSVTVIMDGQIKTTATNGIKFTNGAYNYLKINIVNVNSGIGGYGCNIDNHANAIIDVTNIKNFTKGLYITGTNRGCAYNKFSIIAVNECKNSVVLEHVGSGYVNENLFINGRLTSSVANTIGIQIIGSSLHYSNNNTFLHTSVEGLTTGIDITKGQNNSFINVRTEAVTTALVINRDNASRNNVVSVGYGSITSKIESLGNHIYIIGDQTYMKPLYDSGFLCENACSNASELIIDKKIGQLQNDYSIGGITAFHKTNTNIMRNSSSSKSFIGVMVDTTMCKHFYVNVQMYSGDHYVVCYDSNNQIIANSTDFIGGTYRSLDGVISAYKTNTSAGQVRTSFIVPSNCVKCFIGFYEFVNITCFNILAADYSYVYGNLVKHALSSIPTCVGLDGDVCYSSATGTTGWIYQNSTWNVIP